MKQLEEILLIINEQIDAYQTLQLKQVSEQSEILKKLSTALAQLEVHRADYYDQWLNVYFMCKHNSDAARCKWADNEVKELHRIRKIMRGGYKVVESIRSTISVGKKENV